MSDRPAQRNLVLILARNFAAQLATSVFLVDDEGTVIYYNEAAGRALGRRFIEGRDGMPASEWSTVFAPRDADGEPIPLERITRSVPRSSAGSRPTASCRSAARRVRTGGSRSPRSRSSPTATTSSARSPIFWELGEEG